MDTRPATPLLDHHPVPVPARELIDGIVAAVRASDDATIRALLIRLAPMADTTVLLLLRYRLGLSENPRETPPSARPEMTRSSRARDDDSPSPARSRPHHSGPRRKTSSPKSMPGTTVR